MDIEYELQGKDKVVISLRDFENMLDVIAYDKTKTSPEELFPAEFSAKLIKGENPLKAFRKYRRLSQAVLAEHARVPQGLISEIETRKKKGSINTLKALATALNVDIDDLIE